MTAQSFPHVTPRVVETRDDGSTLRVAHIADMDPVVVYTLCKLRQDVFVIEQQVYDEPELDGRDLEAGTVLVWWERDGQAFGTIRVMHEGTTMRIGRLAMARTARRGGFGSALMRAAIALCGELQPDWRIEIHGQSYLKEWYESMGYVTTGSEFQEAGIAHYPMEYRPGH